MTHLAVITFLLSLSILPQSDAGRTVWDGVYTRAQAERGALAYGYLIHQPEFERISVTSLQTVAPRCG